PAEDRGAPPCDRIRAFRALGPCNDIEQQTGREITASGHQKRRNGIDRESNEQISRAPDQIERSEGGNDRQSGRRSHRQISAEVKTAQVSRASADCYFRRLWPAM